MTTLSILQTLPNDPDGRRGRDLLRAAARGSLIKLAPGRFVRTDEWEHASPADRHRARLRAVMPSVAPHLIVSHASAVALHDLPWIGEFPEVLTLTDTRRITGQRRVRLEKVPGCGRSIATHHLAGHRVTTLAVTGTDVALREERRAALVVLDAVMARGVPHRALIGDLMSRVNPRAAVRAQALIELADPRSGSPGESVTRLLMHDLGLPTPVLQQPFHDHRGLIGKADFWFAEQGVIVEFDGMVKYRDRTMRRGRNAEQVVIDEKRREDRLRALPEVRAVVRPIWADVEPGGQAREMFRRAGLPVH